MKDGLKHIVGKTIAGARAEIGTRAPETLASRMKRDLDAWTAAKAAIDRASKASRH